MEQSSYKIKTEQFEGPLDLLLTLIEKRKLFINEISLARIADDYVAYIQKLEHFPIADTANFILVASTLVLIKSRSLLPNLALTEEEEGDISDLEERLRIYKQIRDLSVHIKETFGKHIIFQAEARKVDPVFSPDTEMTVANIFVRISDVLKNLPKKELIPKAIVKKVLSLEETIGNLTQRIKSSLKMSFKEFAGMGREEKVNIIVSFLAMLELVKQGIINVRQENRFEDIHMETDELTVPKYTN